jgi:hypothetical protein
MAPKYKFLCAQVSEPLKLECGSSNFLPLLKMVGPFGRFGEMSCQRKTFEGKILIFTAWRRKKLR